MAQQNTIVSILLIGLALSIPVLSQEIPTGGDPVLPEDAAIRMSLQGSSLGRRTIVDVDSMPFDRAIQAETTVLPDNTWGVQLGLSISAAVDEDDALLAVFYARGIESSQESGEAFSEFIFETAADPWDKSISFPISVVGEWKQYFIPFSPVQDYSIGGANVLFRLGYNPQTIQFGGLELLNYHDAYEVEDLPRTTPDYEGKDPDAPWRAQAEQMIDTYRKADIAILVLDDNSNPVEDGLVRVEMKKHAYKFGSAVDARRMMQGDSDAQQYNETIETYFNRVVMENDLKWGPWESWDRNATLDALDMLNDMGIEIRGHCLVWPSWNNTPDDLEENENNPIYLEIRVLDHIEEEAGALSGMLVDWDVINEPFWNHDIMDVLGDEVMVDWFNKTREMDQTAILYLNDNNIISGGGVDAAHQEDFYNTVQFLLDNGAPLQGLGTQCHFGTNVTPPERIWAVLDHLAGYGLEIQATEFDIDSPYEDLQVDYTRDFMTAYFAHPSTVGILTWGFWDGQHWKPTAAFWDEDWNLRPHGETWVELVTETWWTNEELFTDSQGEAATRGFLGEYEISIQNGESQLTTDFSLGLGETMITVIGSSIGIQNGISDSDHQQASSFSLGSNYPNPFNSDTSIPYIVPRSGNVRITIYNSRGQRIKVLIDAGHKPGQYRLTWDGSNEMDQQVSSGIYLIRMQAKNFSASRKITLLR